MSEVANPGVLRDITDSAVSSSWRERIRIHPAADLFPPMSEAELAAATRTSESTVSGALAEPAVPSGTPERVTGRDGKSYPAKTPSTRKPKAGAAPAQGRARAIMGLSVILCQELRNTLEDLVRILGDERRQIAALPLEKGVALARGYLLAFDINLNDLRPDGCAQ